MAESLHHMVKQGDCGEQAPCSCTLAAPPSPHLLGRLFCLLLLVTELEEFGDLEKARDYTDLDRKGSGGGGKKERRKGSIGSYRVRKGGNDG